MQGGSQEEDEDDGTWIPLDDHRESPSSQSQSATEQSQTQASDARQHDESSSRTIFSSLTSLRTRRNRPSPAAPSSMTMEALQKRLEVNSNLKRNLVDHPIHLFWKRFFLHLLQELWALDLYLRIGLIFIVAGVLLKIFLLSTWYLWYPRLVFLTLLLGASFVYLDPLDMRRQWNSVMEAMLSPDKWIQIFEQLDLSQFRRFSVLLFLIPTALEMRTLSFLSQIKAESGWFFYNFLLSTIICSTMMYLFQVKSWRPRDCTYKGLLILYGSSLFVTIVKTDLRRMPVLAAPFFLATGTLLVTYHDDDMEWLSRVVRHALRLTLRDVLASVSEKVGADEMLQLSILRWIVDYWSYTPSSGNEPSTEESRAGARSSTGSQTTSSSQARPSSPLSSSSSGISVSQTLQRRHEVQWNELLPMLTMATDQMATEVSSFQSPLRVEESAASNSSSNSTNESSSQQQHNNTSVNSLKDMLMSLDVDKRGKPAVQAYRNAVLSFPPTKETALVLSIVRRCPALMTLVWHFFFGTRSTLFTVFVIMAPFVSIEYFRVGFWMQSCHNVSKLKLGEIPGVEEEESSGDASGNSLLANANSMTILLSGDSHSNFNPPTLLLVWNNILGSLKALEVGLTAARCAQTTSVAMDFTYNIASLAQFGYEVSQRGLGHGIAIMAKEMIFMHVAGESNQQARSSNNLNTKYTCAAMDAVQNGQVVVRNVQALLEDENLEHVVKPVMHVLCAISGYGWLWGEKEESLQPNEKSGASDEDVEEMHFDFVDDHPVDGTQQATEESSDVQDLPALMEAISVAYENNAIDTAKKNSLCLRLAQLSEEEQSSPHSDALDEIWKDLKDLSPSFQSELEQQQKKEGEGETVMKSTPMTKDDSDKDEVSVVDLVAEAYLQGSITEDEKNSFLRQLANLSETQRSDPNVSAGIRRTLEALIEPNDDENDHVSAWEPMLNTPDKEISEETPLVDVMSRNVVMDGKGKSRKTEPLSETVQDEDTRTNDNDTWKKLGIAALGVVVGGVVLSMQGEDKGDQGNNSSDGNRGNQERNTSSVVIEELDVDAEDEWVAVPNESRE